VELHRHHEHSPFRSWQAFLGEIATIVIGVLIALSFEGAREWQHNRTLANEARETIVRELTANKNEVDGEMKGMANREQQLKNARHYVNDVLKTGKSSIQEMSLNSNWGDLRRSSWTTAQQTGALGHMLYSEVQAYAYVYDLQDLYQAQQRRSLEHMAETLALLGSVINAPTAQKGDLERFRDGLQTMGADAYLEKQLAAELTERYTKTLQEHAR
jgi:hypothetical protein